MKNKFKNDTERILELKTCLEKSHELLHNAKEMEDVYDMVRTLMKDTLSKFEKDKKFLTAVVLNVVVSVKMVKLWRLWKIKQFIKIYKMKKEDYRIVEHHYKFYVEYLEKLLWWTYYSEVMENTDEFGQGGNVRFFDTLEDAKKFVEGCKIKYHKI